jgi:CHAT domain-containing protein
LVVENQQENTSQPSVIIANPDFNLGRKRIIPSKEESSPGLGRPTMGQPYAAWNMLPSTELEGRNITRLLNGRMISGGDATAGTVKSLVSPRILHVASHGFATSEGLREDYSSVSTLGGVFRGGDSLLESRAGFVLAGANYPIESDDGVISLGEAASLRLNGTELVVLSACSTGQGEVRTGEGVYGLQRSLTVAGARSTLLSLWKVDDAATAEFMTRFYQRLKAGEGRADALAAVQREFRSGIAGKPDDWKRPYYWAAWQLVGDWRPIPGL